MNRPATTGDSPSIILATLGGMLFGSLATLALLMFIAQVAS